MRERTVALFPSLRLAPPWEAEAFKTSDGDWLLVITSASADTTYVVTATQAGFDLAEMVDDRLQPLAAELDADSLTAQVRHRLTAQTRAA